MGYRTRITQAAKARGFSAAEVARRTGFYRSNISAMDAGRRSVSLAALARIAQILDCGPSDLISFTGGSQRALSQNHNFMKKVADYCASQSSHQDVQWVHKALLAWQRHFMLKRRER